MLKSKKSGFTLIELSVVLVIIALIIGGVMVGRSLIRTSQLQSVISEAQRYTQAIGQFKDKYRALPGDFTRATALWGAIDNDAEICKTTPSTPPATCNGNGDGQIAVQVDGNQYETFRAWQHMNNAGFVEFFGTGIAGTTNDYERIVGENIPPSKLSGAGWGIVNITVNDINDATVDGTPYVQNDIPPNTLLWFGGGTIDEPGKRMNKQYPKLIAEEARDIDQKVDDGYPNSGKVIAQINPAVPFCATATDADGTYDTSNGNTHVCSIMFKTGY